MLRRYVEFLIHLHRIQSEASIPIINDLLVVSGIAQTLMKQASRSNFLLPTLEHDASIQEYARVESTRRRLAVDSTSTADEVERALRNVQRLTRLNNVQIDHHRGMVRSFFSTTTHFPLTAWSRSATNYRKVGADARQFPVWAVWGTVDELIPMALFARLQEWVPRVRLLSVQDAGHSLVVENVTSVLKHVVSALAVPVK